MQTEELRNERRARRQATRELNNIGKRLAWIREKLGLSRSDVIEGTDIAPSSLSDWENGVRTSIYEYVWLLAKFYDELWRAKYDRHFPKFEDVTVEDISFEFILIGRNLTLENAKRMAREIEGQIAHLKIQYESERAFLKSQLDLFEGSSHGA